jgi:hypothetical protein
MIQSIVAAILHDVSRTPIITFDEIKVVSARDRGIGGRRHMLGKIPYYSKETADGKFALEFLAMGTKDVRVI